MNSPFVLAAARDDIADFLQALLQVYVILIIAYIIFSLIYSFGKMPYNRVFSAVFDFLRSVVEPFLAIFRRFIPPIGMFDLSPIVAILLLQIVGQIIINVVRG